MNDGSWFQELSEWQAKLIAGLGGILVKIILLVALTIYLKKSQSKTAEQLVGRKAWKNTNGMKCLGLSIPT